MAVETLPRISSGGSVAHSGYGFLVMKFGDLGPIPVADDQLPFDDYEKKKALGVYLALVVGQGKGAGEQGLYGPIPWNDGETTFEVMTFAYLAQDPSVKDARAKHSGVMVFLVTILPPQEEELLHARLAFEKTLTHLFVRSENNLDEVDDATLALHLQWFKETISSTVTEGEKLLQEQAMDQLMDHPALQHFFLFDPDNPQDLVEVVGEAQRAGSLLNHVRHLRVDLLYTDINDQPCLFLSFPSLQRQVLVVFNKKLDRKSVLDIVVCLRVAKPLLEQYFLF